MLKIDREVVNSAMSYSEYRKLIENLLEKNKTTGQNHSPSMLHYTTMNAVRMDRLDKTTRIADQFQEQLKVVRQPLVWLVLTEAWCGDAAQSIPVMARMADQNPGIELRLILRDENPRIMDAFLTEGGRSIPKLIILRADTLEVLGTWGPRPAAAQALVREGRAATESLTDEPARKERYQKLAADLQKWYAKDKTRSIQEEIIQVVLKSQRVAV